MPLTYPRKVGKPPTGLNLSVGGVVRHHNDMDFRIAGAQGRPLGARSQGRHHGAGSRYRGGGGCGPHFPAFSAFFSHFPGRSLSVMFKRKHSNGI